jgi:hypothetical protein
MMPTVSISDSLYAKLKLLAVPFEDTVETVITRCVDFYAAKGGLSLSESTTQADQTRNFPGDNPPDLTFSRPVAIRLDGTAFEKKDLYWNNLMFEVIRRAAKKIPTEKLKQIIVVNHVDGVGALDKGYRFIPDAKLSVQGQDSNAAWKAAFYVVKATGMDLEVSFSWENKEKAAYPGATGRMAHQTSGPK